MNKSDDRSDKDDEALAMYLGEEVLSYLFAEKLWRIGSPDHAGVEATAAIVIGMLRKARVQMAGNTSNTRRSLALGLTMPFEGTPLIMRLRNQCGGAPVLEKTGDDVADALLEVAELALVFSKMPVGSADPWGENSVFELLDHLLVLDACRAAAAILAKDDSIALAFGCDDDQTTSTDNLCIQALWSSGGGGTRCLDSLPRGILSDSLLAMRFAGEHRLSAAGPYLAASVDRVRAVFRERHAPGYVVVSLENMTVEDNVFLEFAKGRLLSPAGLERVVPWIGSRTTCVIILEVEIRLLRSECWKRGTNTGEWLVEMMTARADDFARAQQNIRERVDSVRLALLFASQGLPFLAPALISTGWSFAGFGGGASWSISPHAYPEVVRSALESTVVSVLREKLELVGRLPATYAMSTRRLLSAASERVDNTDSFVDAVICWESLLGTRGETTFRLCAAMAHVLEPDSIERRRELYQELSCLYKIRSDAVHGAEEPSPHDAAKYRNRAIRIAVDLFAMVLGDPVLRQASGSEARSKKILLGDFT